MLDAFAILRMKDVKNQEDLTYRKSSIKPPGGRRTYLLQAHLRGGGLKREGGLFNLEKTMVSVLHNELEYKVEKLKNKKVGGHAAEDQNQIRTSSW